MAFVSVDDLRTGVAESMRNEKGCWLAFTVGLAAVVWGAAFAEAHTQPVVVAVGFLIMAGAALALHVGRVRPARSGPPIDPASELAVVEAVVLDRIGQTDETVAHLREELRGFVCLIGGASETIAQRAERLRKTS